MAVTPQGQGLPPRSQLGEHMRQKTAEKTGERRSFLKWSRRVPEPKGPLLFADRRFQLELYSQACAEAQEVVIKKATQLGVSTYLLRWVMYLADLRAFVCIYIFPTQRTMYDFSDARMRPAILGSKYLLGRISAEHVQNKGLKQIGTGFLYARGSESTEGLQSVDADALAMDEYSELRAENIPDAERRIGGSDYGFIRRVGVPDIPGHGLDDLYDKSDRRRWFVKCESCNHQQYLSYDENVDEERILVVCRKCRKPLDVRKGQWVAEFPDRSTRGYHIPKFVMPLDERRLGKIIEAHHKTNPSEVKTHFNKDLAEAYAPEEGRLSSEALKRAQREDLPRYGDPRSGEIRTMGVDVASVRALNVKISAYDAEGRKRTIWLGVVDDFNELVRLTREYDPHFACIDHEPDGRLSRKFAEKFPGRVWLCALSGTQKQVLKPDPDMAFVSVNRTMIYDATLDAIRQQRNLLPEDLPENYKRDLQNIIRRHEVDEKGNTKTWYERRGPEDYAQAEAYDLVAEAIYQWLRGVDEGFEGETFELDQEVDFERAQLDQGTLDTDVDDDTYNPGFGGDGPYDAGFDEDEP